MFLKKNVQFYYKSGCNKMKQTLSNKMSLDVPQSKHRALKPHAV